MMGESGPDYSIWLPSGEAGFIEMKSRKGGRIPLSAVKGLQRTMLDRAVRWGQLAFVIVRLDEEWYAIDWRRFTHETKRSLNQEDLAVRGALIEMKQGLPMFLPALIEAREKADGDEATIGGVRGSLASPSDGERSIDH